MEKSIEINPYNVDFYYNLAIIYEFLGDNKKVDELFVKALELEPDNENIRNKLNNLK